MFNGMRKTYKASKIVTSYRAWQLNYGVFVDGDSQDIRLFETVFAVMVVIKAN